MNKIEFEGIELYYHPSGGDGYKTLFYLKRPNKRKKYYLFGQPTEKIYYEHILTIPASSENPIYSKEVWRQWLQEHLVELKRRVELIKGELI